MGWRGGGGVCVCVCRGAPSSAEVHLSTSLFPLLTCFFTFANETICMAEEEEGEGDGGGRRWD